MRRWTLSSRSQYSAALSAAQMLLAMVQDVRVVRNHVAHHMPAPAHAVRLLTRVRARPCRLTSNLRSARNARLAAQLELRISPAHLEPDAYSDSAAARRQARRPGRFSQLEGASQGLVLRAPIARR